MTGPVEPQQPRPSGLPYPNQPANHQRGAPAQDPSTFAASAAPRSKPVARSRYRASILRLTWMLSRPGAQSPAALLLPAVAFAVTTAIALTVLGGAMMFWRWTNESAETFQYLSIVALALLLVPFVSLGGSAARLSARRRDDRLATLRLLGATPADVMKMTILESTGVAIIGAVAGVVLYYAISPLVGLIHFGGAGIGAATLWINPLLIIAVIVSVAVIAGASAAIGLRQVNISPLGVRTKQSAPTVRGLRIIIGLLGIGAAFRALQIAKEDPNFTIFVLVICGAFATGVGILNLIGPWAIARAARRSVKRARSAQRLLAARNILESPKGAWRQVSGVAMTSFIAVAAGSLMAVAATDDPETAIINADIRTGVLIVLFTSFIITACSVGVNQASAIYDRRELYVSLDRLGMPREVIENARTRAVMSPLLLVSLGSAIIAGILVFPLFGIALITAPLSTLVIAASLTTGIGIVRLALMATRPVLTTVLHQPERI